MKAPEKTNRKKLVLLDSHAIIHRAYHALPDFVSSKGEPTGALYGLVMMLLNIIGHFKPDYIVAAFDLPGPTYRHEAYKEYKATRKKGDDALYAQIERAREVLAAFGIPLYEKPGFEADDMLGTIVEELKGNNEIDIVIASGDMDTMQLIEGKKVQVYTLKKGIKDTILYDEKAVLERFGFAPEYLPDYKGLRGDPSDNIPGIKGVGEKTATTVICEYHTIENLYKALEKDPEKVAKKVGFSERMLKLFVDNKEEAEFSKALAVIRRDAPIDFKLPAKEFTEGFDMEKINVLFDDLEFKSLKDRVRFAVMKESGLPALPDEARQAGGGELETDIEYDPTVFQEASIMRWIVDTNLARPETDDILRFTKQKTLPAAHAALLEEIKKRNQTRVWEEIEKPLIPIVEQMRKAGIRLDVPYLEKLSREYHELLSGIEKRIYEHAGREFNIGSPKQLGEILFNEMDLKGKRQKKTAGGALSTKESELVKMKDMHPIIDEILKYRELSKLVSTYIDVLPTLCDRGGRLHASFIQNGAATGRMSSEHPNMQNIPIKSEAGRKIRHAFMADPGYKLVAIDYSQIELRIAAFLSGDEKLIEIFRQGQDVHTAVAAQVFKVEPESVDKEMRRKAKVINFGILYGMGVNALRENLHGTREEAQLFYNTYFETFTRLASYLDEVKADTARKGYTETFFGRRRYMEGMTSKLPYVRAIAERAAINAPIQGTEADVIKLAMVQIAAWIKESKLEDEVRMLLQVHDELVFEIKDNKVKEVTPQIRKIMETIIDTKDTKGITLSTEASVGDNWGEMEDII